MTGWERDSPSAVFTRESGGRDHYALERLIATVKTIETIAIPMPLNVGKTWEKSTVSTCI